MSEYEKCERCHQWGSVPCLCTSFSCVLEDHEDDPQKVWARDADAAAEQVVAEWDSCDSEYPVAGNGQTMRVLVDGVPYFVSGEFEPRYYVASFTQGYEDVWKSRKVEKA